MNTYLIRDTSGCDFAFEIENIYLGIKKVVTLLQLVDGVSDIKIRRLFSPNSEVHIEFIYLGKSFVVWEPYGDSSRYWIGPKNDSQQHIDISIIERVFRKYQPHIIRKMLGDLVMFKIIPRQK